MSAGQGAPLKAGANGQTATRVDHNVLRFHQACLILCLLAAFVLDAEWVVLAVAAVMLIDTLRPGTGLFKLLARRVAQPAGLLRRDLRIDEMQPHLFAQGVGGIVLLAASLAFSAGAATLGWVLAGVVVLLAAVNLFAGFCVGCFLYYQLGRAGIRPSLPSWRSPARTHFPAGE